MTDPLPTDGPEGTAPATTGSERRQSTRRESSPRLRLRLSSGATCEARMVDITDGGVQVELTGPGELPGEGPRLMLELVDGGGEAPPRPGEVRWEVDADQPRIGVRFLSEGDGPSKPTGLLDIDQIKVNPRVAMRFPAARARRWQVLPFAASDERVIVAAADAHLGQARAALDRCYRKEIEVHEADPDALRRAIERIYAGADSLSSGADLGASADAVTMDEGETDAVALYDQMFAAAIMYGTSDVHIDSFEHSVRIRGRVDGQIEHLRDLSVDSGTALISRIKVMAGLDISERRAPQDGRLLYESGSGMRVQVRVPPCRRSSESGSPSGSWARTPATSPWERSVCRRASSPSSARRSGSPTG